MVLLLSAAARFLYPLVSFGSRTKLEASSRLALQILAVKAVLRGLRWLA